MEELRQTVKRLEKSESEIKTVLEDLSANFKSLAIALVGDQYNPTGGLTGRVKQAEEKIIIIETRQVNNDKKQNRILIWGSVVLLGLNVGLQVALKYL